MFTVGLYTDTQTGKSRYAVYHTKTSVWYFPTRYGKDAAIAYANRLNSEAKA